MTSREAPESGRQTIENNYSFSVRMEKIRSLDDGLLGGGAAVSLISTGRSRWGLVHLVPGGLCTLPNTVLEAMAMGVPIVSTDVDGVSEAVTHDQEALLVPPRDPEGLAQGVRSLLQDPDLADRLSRAARSRVEREFSFAARMRRVEEIYRTVMAGGRSTQPAAPPAQEPGPEVGLTTT